MSDRETETTTLLQHGISLLNYGWPRAPEAMPNGARVGWVLPQPVGLWERTELTLVYRAKGIQSSVTLTDAFVRDVDEAGFAVVLGWLERECQEHFGALMAEFERRAIYGDAAPGSAEPTGLLSHPPVVPDPAPDSGTPPTP